MTYFLWTVAACLLSDCCKIFFSVYFEFRLTDGSQNIGISLQQNIYKDLERRREWKKKQQPKLNKWLSSPIYIYIYISWLNAWTDGWLDEEMNGPNDRWMDGWTAAGIDRLAILTHCIINNPICIFYIFILFLPSVTQGVRSF